MATSRQALRARRRGARAQRAKGRRAAAIAALALLAVGAFALGALSGAGDGGGGSDATAATADAVVSPFSPPQPLPPLGEAQLAGQRLIAGFVGTRPPAGLRRMIGRGRLAGVILFAGNVEGRRATARLISSLQRIPRPTGLDAPLLVMVDQEGGPVKRLEGPPSASAEEMGARGTAFASGQGAATARSLRGYGFNVDLAPVLDVGRRGSAIADEHRSFGRRPARVIGTAVNGFAGALREGGIAATAKHFPGFGAAEVNTDLAAQRIEVGPAKLRRIDEAPFEAFADAGGQLVMLALASYRGFGERPAALTRAIATGELRERVGFEGVSITDSLDAAAVQSFADRGRVATLAAAAGCDLLLYGSWRTARTAASALRRELRSGQLDREEFEASVKRVLALRGELGS